MHLLLQPLGSLFLHKLLLLVRECCSFLVVLYLLVSVPLNLAISILVFVAVERISVKHVILSVPLSKSVLVLGVLVYQALNLL